MPAPERCFVMGVKIQHWHVLVGLDGILRITAAKVPPSYGQILAPRCSGHQKNHLPKSMRYSSWCYASWSRARSV